LLLTRLPLVSSIVTYTIITDYKNRSL